MGGPDDPVFTTEVYAQPSSNISVANPPVPKWLLRAIDGDSEIFDAFALEVQDTTQDWGLYTDICRYHHTDVELTNIASRIRALEAEEAETCNTLANCHRRQRRRNPRPPRRQRRRSPRPMSRGRDHPLHDAWSRSHLTGG
jgi:hypothetical protein